MPINDFNGNTFVAFIDISGFKELMKQGKAWQALGKFYQLGYEILHERQADDLKVEGIFVSDCGILFVRGNNSSEVKRLKALLEIVEKINKGMLEPGYMLTTSIAYGHFKYQGRIEFEGIEKNPVYGDAYTDSYFDNEHGHPSIQPGQCRVVIENLPIEMSDMGTQQDIVLNRIKKEGAKHFYFYWNVESPERIERFKNNYRDSYNLKYAGMLKALKGQ